MPGITLDDVKYDGVVPGTAKRRNPTHQIKLLSNDVFYYIPTKININKSSFKDKNNHF